MVHSPQFLDHVYYSQTARWVKMPLGREVGLGPGNVVRWGPAPPLKGTRPPIFGPCLLWPNGRLSQLLLSSCLHSSSQSVPVLYNGPPLPPQNCPFPWGIWTPCNTWLVPWDNPSLSSATVITSLLSTRKNQTSICCLRSHIVINNSTIDR